MDGSSSATGSGGMTPPSQMPPAGGGPPRYDAGSLGGMMPLDFNQKQFSLGASKGPVGSGQADPSPAMQWAKSMVMTWINQSNAQSQQWVQSIAEDQDYD